MRIMDYEFWMMDYECWIAEICSGGIVSRKNDVAVSAWRYGGDVTSGEIRKGDFKKTKG